MKKSIILVLTVVITVFFNSTILAQEISVVATADNTLWESAGGTISSGHGSSLYAGRSGSNALGLIKRAVLRFDLTGQLPVGAVVQSVRLKLNVNKTNAATGAQTFSLHRLESDWGEGASDAGTNGNGTSAEPGDATWLNTFFPNTLWTTPGGDFAAASSGNQIVDAVGSYEWGSSAEIVADVQSWLDDPEANFGWILIGNEEKTQTAKRFSSRENSTIANRPVLMLTFSTTTGIVDENELVPGAIRLAQNFPNPFNPTTNIEYQLTQSSLVDLSIYNILGKKVATLVNKDQAAGTYNVQWNALGFISGMYYYKLQTNVGYEQTRKLILLK